MKQVLKKLFEGETVDTKYFRGSWLSENKSKLVGGGISGVFLLFVLFLVLISAGGNKPSPPIAPPFGNFSITHSF